MEEVGKVVEVSGDTVKVELEASEKCGHCGANIMCHADSDGKAHVMATNREGAKLGDRVKIEVAPGISVLAAFLLFVVPIAAFFIGFAVVKMLVGNENLAILGGSGGLILFFLFLIRINRKVAKTRRFHPVVKEIEY
jgi:sigma-E factor negative regulatory protein RseC